MNRQIHTPIPTDTTCLKACVVSVGSGRCRLCRLIVGSRVGSLSVTPTHLETTLRDLAAPRGALNLDR